MPVVRTPPAQVRNQLVVLTPRAGFVFSRNERKRMICQSRKRI